MGIECAHNEHLRTGEEKLKSRKRWSFPLIVIGANSIAVYVVSWTIERFVSENLVRHLGRAPFLLFGPGAACLSEVRY